MLLYIIDFGDVVVWHV